MALITITVLRGSHFNSEKLEEIRSKNLYILYLRSHYCVKSNKRNFSLVVFGLCNPDDSQKICGLILQKIIEVGRCTDTYQIHPPPPGISQISCPSVVQFHHSKTDSLRFPYLHDSSLYFSRLFLVCRCLYFDLNSLTTSFPPAGMGLQTSTSPSRRFFYMDPLDQANGFLFTFKPRVICLYYSPTPCISAFKINYLLSSKIKFRILIYNK